MAAGVALADAADPIDARGLIATPVRAELSGAQRVGWQHYNGQLRAAA